MCNYIRRNGEGYATFIHSFIRSFTVCPSMYVSLGLRVCEWETIDRRSKIIIM